MNDVGAAWQLAVLCAVLVVPGPREPRAAESAPAVFFQTQVAPLLARHCLECHNAATPQGDLDLSQAATALAGGEHGPAIVPGRPAESLAWQRVAADEMPQDRPLLSAEEKAVLAEWIEAGADWSLERIEADAAAGPSAPPLARLTVGEYAESVRVAVGVELGEEARLLLPPDRRADGFSNTAYHAGVDLAHVQAYARLARLAAERVDAAALAARFGGCRSFEDECLETLVRQLGREVLRGPLTAEEVELLLPVPQAVAEQGGTFDDAVRLLVQAMLQSPRFLYRIEQAATGEPLPPHELACRLSYMLWGSPPDQRLWEVADRGGLADERTFGEEVERMLEDPRARRRSLVFIDDWLHLGRLASLRPAPAVYPAWNSHLARDMQQETRAFCDEVLWVERRPLAALLNARFTHASPQLARHYGLLPSPAASVRAATATSEGRRGLQAVYLFETPQEEARGIVRDLAGTGEPLDLVIADPEAVDWREDGLHVRQPTVIATASPPGRLIEAIRRTGELSIEAWITPASLSQVGPARIVSISSGPSQRNLTLGQDGERFDARLRAATTNANGVPSLASPAAVVEQRPMHVVFTKEASGATRLFVDGELQGSGHVGAELASWDAGFPLLLANEPSGDRPWLGTYHALAIYDRTLDAKEIRGRGGVSSRYDLGDRSDRGGLLTQGSLLTLGGDDASMVTRGLFVLEDLLSGHVGNPPPCVDTTPVPPRPGLSRRGLAETRLANQACGSCHARFEPLAFALEKYDGIGGFHEVDEHGNPLREDGEVRFPGAAEPVPFATAREFFDLLAGSDRVQLALTKKVIQFALGRPLTAADMPHVTAIHAAAVQSASGGSYQAVMRQLMQSELVRRPSVAGHPGAGKPDAVSPEAVPPEHVPPDAFPGAGSPPVEAASAP